MNKKLNEALYETEKGLHDIALIDLLCWQHDEDNFLELLMSLRH